MKRTTKKKRAVAVLALAALAAASSCCIDIPSPENGEYAMVDVYGHAEIVEASLALGDDEAVLTYVLEDGSMWEVRWSVQRE